VNAVLAFPHALYDISTFSSNETQSHFRSSMRMTLHIGPFLRPPVIEVPILRRPFPPLISEIRLICRLSPFIPWPSEVDSLSAIRLGPFWRDQICRLSFPVSLLDRESPLFPCRFPPPPASPVDFPPFSLSPCSRRIAFSPLYHHYRNRSNWDSGELR